MSDNPEALRRLWPIIEKAMGGLVFTADKAGEVTADMATVRAALAQQAATPTDAVAAFEEAMRQTWRMIDPLHPAGQPGSYARGQDAGIAAALKTVRENFERLLAVRQAATPTPAEPVAWMWQHDETGRTGFVDAWQLENGWREANPRLLVTTPLYRAPPATPAAQPADGWIAVADRLPYSAAENGERVLVCTAEDDFAGVQFHDIKATDFFEVDEDGRMGTEVTEVATHWRPRVLPAAPDGSQG